MQKLTKAEEQIMHLIWELKRCLVSDILKRLGEPRPPHSTIASVVRILEKKGFVDHKAYGRTHEYFPTISKEEYTRKSIKKLVNDYFDGSMHRLVSFLVNEENMTLEEIAELLPPDESKNL